MMHIRVIPDVIGVAVDTETGNPVVIGEDRGTGMVVSIQVDAAYWKQFTTNVQRLEGVGRGSGIFVPDLVGGNGTPG
jgi:hypothetical protein